MTMALPVALKERHPVRTIGLDLMGEREWDDRAAEAGMVKPARLLPMWIFLLLPFVAALVLIMHGARLASIQSWFLLCALAAGFYLAKVQNRSGGGLILMGLVYSFAALIFYVILAFGLLFVGCLVALH